MPPDPPLHVLESARRRLDSLFGAGDCCMHEVEDHHIHPFESVYAEDSIDRKAVIDLLDRAIETKRRERDLARAGAGE